MPEPEEIDRSALLVACDLVEEGGLGVGADQLRAMVGRTVLVRATYYHDGPSVVACRPAGARGRGGSPRRPLVVLSDSVDDFAWLSDEELGTAPTYPGSFEGADGKPVDYDDPLRLNRWCARECERSVILRAGPLVLPDFTRRVANVRGHDPYSASGSSRHE